MSKEVDEIIVMATDLWTRSIAPNKVSGLTDNRGQLASVAIAIRDALTAAGYAIVLVEPTEAMLDAACAEWIQMYPASEGEKPNPTAEDVVKTLHRAMLETASPGYTARRKALKEGSR